MSSVTEKRWELAQSYEKKHWQKQLDRIRAGGSHVDWYEWNASQLTKFLKPFLKNTPERVLEIGSGPVGTISYLPWDERYAVDPLEDYFASQPELVRFRDQRVSYRRDTGERLPFDSDFFSLVICENVLDHTRSPAQVLGEVKRVLAPDGLFFMSVNIHTSWGAFLRRLMELAHIDKGHPHSYPLKNIRKLLSDAGYEVLREDVEDHKEVRLRNLRSRSYKNKLKGYVGISEIFYKSVNKVADQLWISQPSTSP